MQTMGTFMDGEWESICKLFSVEESDFSANLPEYSPPGSHQDDNLTFPTPLSFSYESSNNNSPVFLPGDGNSHYSSGLWSSNLVQDVCADNTLFSARCFNDLPMSNEISLSLFDFSMVDGENNRLSRENNTTVEGNDSVNLSSPSIESTIEKKRNASVLQGEKEEKTSSTATPKKKARVTRDAQKGKGKARPKKDEITPIVNNAEEYGCDNSEDESNASEEINDMANSESKKVVAKKRASRGAATDPQSLYARKRRMRINERLRILQNLVPNGTKVDISTMLEEAFHYVKFMQHQIRLLSSDDLWMFAPLAYNGLDVGAYRRISPFL